MFKIILFSFFSFEVYATPLHVIIIRHAEKPESGNDLSSTGFTRANFLINFFTNSSFSKKYNVPQNIFASKPEDELGSIRSIQTVIPLSKSLNISINTSFKRDEFDALAKEILNNPDYNNKTILISWPHKRIKDIVNSLGVTKFKKKWKDNTFDRLWIVNFEDQTFLSIDDLPQSLLVGDSAL